jgi:multicomponent Na+:H+ antiporter subunit B
VSPRTRLAVFLAAGTGLAVLLAWGVAELPDFGVYRGPYGLVLDRTAVAARHAANLPTAVNFDYRAIDTLGEEFILFSAAIGLAIILRARREGEERAPSGRVAERAVAASDTTRVAGLGLVGATLLLGLYVVTHGHLTPGGGFQGGVVLAGALLLVYLSGGYVTVRRLSPWAAIEACEGAGAGGFAALGVAGLVAGAAFFDNVLPLGHVGDSVVGGTIPLANVVVGIEVGAAFAMVFSELLEQALVVRS